MTTSTPGSSTLKERIAALQQRSTSPQLSSPPRKTASGVPIPKNALRDKIARFEEKGNTSKPKTTIGLGKASARDGKQTDTRIKSLGSAPLASEQVPQRNGYNRSVSEAHESSRDSASSPTLSSHGDTFSETYEEDIHSQFSSAPDSPRSNHSHETKGVTLPKFQDDETQAASTSVPSLAVNVIVEPLVTDLSHLNLEAQDGSHSLKSDAEPDKILLPITDGDQDGDKSQFFNASEDCRTSKISCQAPRTTGNSLGIEIVEQPSLSDSTISVPTSLDDSANQVLPILDAFPTVPGHIPLSQSSRSTCASSQQIVINPPEISNIHSIPLASSSIASNSPTVTTLNNNLETSTACRRPSQGRKPVPRPKSSVPFWYDDDSDDGETGWVSVTVTTRRYQ